MKSYNILSLGAGVQSSTMALMASLGELSPMPDVAIFADTGWEQAHTYEYLQYLKPLLAFPLIHIKEKNILADLKNALDAGRFASIPFYTDSKNKNGGMLRRQCTREYKIDSIHKYVREFVGVKKGVRVKSVHVCKWIGISIDEASRMKPSRHKWVTNAYPLIELGMSRNSCLNWLEKNNLKAPGKSSCVGCVYRDDSSWGLMKKNSPLEFAEAVEVDNIIRNGIRGTTEKLFMHRSMKPLIEVDFSSLEDLGQMNMFENECEGICGV